MGFCGWTTSYDIGELWENLPVINYVENNVQVLENALLSSVYAVYSAENGEMAHATIKTRVASNLCEKNSVMAQFSTARSQCQIA